MNLILVLQVAGALSIQRPSQGKRLIHIINVYTCTYLREPEALRITDFAHPPTHSIQMARPFTIGHVGGFLRQCLDMILYIYIHTLLNIYVQFRTYI